MRVVCLCQFTGHQKKNIKVQNLKIQQLIFSMSSFITVKDRSDWTKVVHLPSAMTVAVYQ